MNVLHHLSLEHIESSKMLEKSARIIDRTKLTVADVSESR